MAENSKAGREPFERIKIVQDFCNNTYGSAPCTASLEAGGKKCFNTRKTCQDPANYDRSELVLSFCKDMQNIPRDEYIIPSVKSISITSATINPSGGNRNSSALGTRGSINVTFQDHAHTDRIVDPYVDERSYDPLEQSTFWAKWRARNPYYLNRPIIYESGYILEDGTIEAGSLITRTYFITSFTGVSASGAVKITGKDAFSLAANEKAKAPFVSAGKLSADIDPITTTASLSPSGIGGDYPASGKVRIGKEVCFFTRSGDVLTIDRAENNTENKPHKAGDTVQLCLEYTSETPANILYDLLSNYAGIPDLYLDKSGWDDEVLSFMPRLYGSIITEPTGVSKLISEITEQMYFYTWWDERDAKVKMRSVRPASDEQITDLNDLQHLVADSVSFNDEDDQLATQVWVYYGQFSPTIPLDERNNYTAIEIIGDGAAESADQYGKSTVKEIFSRWISPTSGAAAIDLGERLLERYSQTPRSCVFDLDAKDNSIRLGDFVRINNRLSVDDEGNSLPTNIQIFSERETIAGTRYSFSGQQFFSQKPAQPNVREVIIGGDVVNIDLRVLHDLDYAAPVDGDEVTFIIRSGVTVGGEAIETEDKTYSGTLLRISEVPPHNFISQTATLLPMQRQGIVALREYDAGTAADPNAGDIYPDTGDLVMSDVKEYPVANSATVGSWPAGVTLKLIIEPGGQILGEGGNGGAHAAAEVSGGTLSIKFFDEAIPAGDGGHALKVTYPIEIDNQGLIAGGGGGGGAESRNQALPLNSPVYSMLACGGAGAGYLSGVASLGTYAFGRTSASILRQAASGSLSSPGVGAITEATSPSGASSSTLRLFANSGFNLGNGSFLPSLDAGGRAGHAVSEGANLITWTNKGDVRGAETN